MRGLLGFRGQSMDGRRRAYPQLAGLIVGSRSGFDQPAPPTPQTYTLTEPLLADIFAWGTGGTGGSHATTATGGGGGSAGYARMLLSRGDTISWEVSPGLRGSNLAGSPSPSNGNNTIVTVGGRVMTAQGGRAGRNDGIAAARSIATGFDVNRYGGGSGERGEQGARTYFDTTSAAYGGGAGGFEDMFPGLMQGRGMPQVSDGTQGALYPAPVGAGGGSKQGSDGNDATWSGPGLVLVLLYRI